VTVEPGLIAALDRIGVANHLMAMAVPFLAGILLSGQAGVLAYPWLSSYVGAALSGRANTEMNLILFLYAFGAQYAIGAIIDLFPPGAAGGYHPRGYQVGFGVLVAAQLLALGWYFAGRGSLTVGAPG
jgi:hypothetical protein